MNSLLHQLQGLIRSGEPVVLATVIRTRGSTPQKPGSSAIFGEQGLLAGTVGGGLLEAEVQQIASHVLISGVSDTYYFNLDSGPDENGSICGGEAEVLVDGNPRIHAGLWETIGHSLHTRNAGRMITIVSRQQGSGRGIARHWIPENHGHTPPRGMDPGDWKLIRDLIPPFPGQDFLELTLEQAAGQSERIAFLELIKPLPWLVIAGAGHVGKALAHIGALLDFHVYVIDDRPGFANKDNIPDADLLKVADVGNAMRELDPRPDTYVVIVTREHRHDAEALRSCIGSNAAYIGMIGSKHKVAVMKKQFLDKGWATEEQWSRIHSPVGIPIGSKTVQEIAVSIAAELVKTRNQKDTYHAS